MYKYLITLIFIPLTAQAHERERLERACSIEQNSLLKERNGTPSCTALKRLKKRSNRPNQPASSAPAQQTSQSKPKKTANGEGSGYRYNPHEGRFCQHNDKGLATTCY